MHTILLLSLACAPRPVAPDAAAALAAPGEVVALSFGWPAGAEARFSVRSEKVSGRGARAQTSTWSRENMALSVRAAGEGGLQVAVDASGSEGAVEFASLPEDLPEGAVEAYLRALLSGPELHVTSSGAFEGADAAEVVQAQREATLAMFPDVEPGAAPGLKEKVSAMINETALSAGAARSWQRVVGMWAGAELEVGAASEVVVSERWGERDAAVTARCTLAAMEACELAAGGRCARILCSFEPGPEALSQATARLQAQYYYPIQELTLDEEIELLTDPASLLPLRLTQRRDRRIELGGRRGSVVVDSSTTTTDYRWTLP